MNFKKSFKPTKGKVVLTIIVYLVYLLLNSYISNPMACILIVTSCPTGSDFWEAKLGPECQSICTYEEYFLVSFMKLFSNMIEPFVTNMYIAIDESFTNELL